MCMGKHGGVNMRVHEYAKNVNKQSKEIIEELCAKGFEVKSASSSITDEMILALDGKEKAVDKKEKSPKKEVETKKVSSAKKEIKNIEDDESLKKNHQTKKGKKAANRRKEKHVGIDEREGNIPVKEDVKKQDKILVYKEGISVGNIAEQIGVASSKVISKLMMLGIMANINQTIDRDTVELIAVDFGFEIKDEVITSLVDFDKIEIIDDEKDLVLRPAVVTVMGHVDHGKTTLLDTIRNTRVVSGEAGGITQHIGAYQVKHDGQLITFIDTPGHAAFTEMRARGAQVTDITILVVAADDGVMPQTREAIDHAKAAGVPIIVAVNKMDKPGANPDKVTQELAELDLLSEEWGGETIFVKVSALKAEGIDNLLEMIQIVTEVEEFKANPKRLATGSVIEARLDKGRGPIATLLVQNGTLKVGDIAVAGNTYGKIRAMFNDKNQKIKIAGPSTPVVILGLENTPLAGDSFMVVNDEKEARNAAKARQDRTKNENFGIGKAVSLDDLFLQIKDGELKQLNVIIKADVQGSAEALRGSLEKIDVDGVKINVVRQGVGAVVETDVTLASASNAIIIGFNVRPDARTRETAKEKGVDIRLYSIIYKAIEEIEQSMTGLLDPEFEEKIIGQAEVRETFKVSKVGTIAGCIVSDGEIQRNSSVRVIRDGVVIYEGKLASLKRFKDDVKIVKNGYECGIMVENYNDLKEQDGIEAYIMEEKKR